MKSFIVAAFLCSIVGLASSASLTRTGHLTADPTTLNVTIEYTPTLKTTHITFVATNLVANGWAAVGFSQNKSMGQAHVFLVKRFTNDSVILKRYINPYHHRYPLPAGSEQGGVLDVISAKYADGVVTVVYTLSQFKTTQESLGDLIPLSQTGTFFPIVAVGMQDDDTEPNYHEDTRTILDGTVELDKRQELFYTTKS